MESIHHIKSRIKTVKNVGQITKAMELVASTKMRKAQDIALRSRPYAFGALELLQNVAANTPQENIFTVARDVKNTLVVLVASDKGLTGSFNTQVYKAADSFFKENKSSDVAGSFLILPIGKKSLQYAIKNNIPAIDGYFGVGDFVTPDECMPIAQKCIDGYLNGRWDKVVVISTHFRTTLRQEVLVRQLMPISTNEIKKVIEEIIPEHGRYSSFVGSSSSFDTAKSGAVEYIFEPSPAAVFEALIPHLLAMQIYHVVLEANASEHSARRVAMKTASDNADDLSGQLTLVYNKARQANITTELIEITSTQQAL